MDGARCKARNASTLFQPPTCSIRWPDAAVSRTRYAGSSSTTTYDRGVRRGQRQDGRSGRHRRPLGTVIRTSVPRPGADTTRPVPPTAANWRRGPRRCRIRDGRTLIEPGTVVVHDQLHVAMCGSGGHDDGGAGGVLLHVGQRRVERALQLLECLVRDLDVALELRDEAHGDGQVDVEHRPHPGFDVGGSPQRRRRTTAAERYASRAWAIMSCRTSSSASSKPVPPQVGQQVVDAGPTAFPFQLGHPGLRTVGGVGEAAHEPGEHVDHHREPRKRQAVREPGRLPRGVTGQRQRHDGHVSRPRAHEPTNAAATADAAAEQDDVERASASRPHGPLAAASGAT